MPRCRSGKLSRYGDSKIRGPVECGDWVVASGGAVARMLDGDGAKGRIQDDAAGEKRRFGEGTAKPSTAFGDRRRRADTPEAITAGDHAATRKVGGARIGCPRGERVDDDHRRATVRAVEGRLTEERCRLRFGCSGNDVQQLARSGEMLPPSGIGEQPVVADAVKATGQNVQQEAAHELVGAERHGLVARLPRAAVVLPAEGDATFVKREQPLVGDRHSVRVAGQIGEHRGWAGKRALGMDDPFTRSQRHEPVGESPHVGEFGARAEEMQPAAVMRRGQFLEEATAEQPREHPHRQEETRSTGDPARAVGSEATTGNDAVHMGMVRQRRSPGVQDQRLCTDLRHRGKLRIGGDAVRSWVSRSDLEQQVIGIHPSCCSAGDRADRAPGV